MTVQDLTPSTNFQVHYEDSIANAKTRAQVIAATCENEFTVLTKWFNITTGFGPSDRIQVYLDRADNSGANNGGYQSGGKSNIHMDVQSTNPNATDAAERIKMIFVNELVEIFMSYNNQTSGTTTWVAGHSDGEALSQLCGIERFRAGHYSYYGSWVDAWLQDATRPDWITTPQNTDTVADSFGCGLLFLYYLKTQLGYPVWKIIQEGGSSLAATYTNLTGKSGAFNAFNGLVAAYYPPGKTPLFNTFDDPFPLLAINERQIFIDITQLPIGLPTEVAHGTAHVTPFPIFCPPKDYTFTIDSTTEQLTCTATTRGFGQPQFAWRVNGVDVTGATASVQATVTVDDTTDPQKQTSSLQTVVVNTAATSTTWTATLVLDVPAAVDGDVDLQVQALVSDTYVSPGTQTTETTWVTAENETVTWEPQYYTDRNACEAAWRDLLEKLVAFKDIPIILTLPDPPPDYDIVMRQIEAMQAVLQWAKGQSLEVSRGIEQGIRARFGLTPELIDQIAKQMGRGQKQAS